MISVRRLPHLYPQDRWLFLTWSLHGAVRPYRFPPPHKALAGRAFVWLDRQLDMARAGPMFLRRDAIANLVVESLHRGAELGHYELASFVVMANHVHVLLLPKAPPSRLLKSLKGCAAREANRLLGRTGEPFWQRETYDHWVRDGHEWGRIKLYIENNPVKAGVVSRAEEYRWSSKWNQMRFDTAVDAVRTSACATTPGAE
jgi:REP element-mobilizing transposase RayT